MNMLLYVVYDTSVWTEFGYTIQRYIASAASVGLKIFAPMVGVVLVATLIKHLTGVGK